MEIIMKEIRSMLPSDQILTSLADRYSYSYDASFGNYLPEVVIQVKNKEEISALLKLANTFNIPVYPRGQGTSLSGGPLPVKGGMVLDMSQWNGDLKIYPDDLVAVVSPGVLTANINQEAEKFGLM